MKIILVLFMVYFTAAEEKKDLMKQIKNISKKEDKPGLKAHDKSIDLDQYKDVKLKEPEALKPANCTSFGGVEYKPGTVGYDSCVREQDTYVPTGSETKVK